MVRVLKQEHMESSAGKEQGSAVKKKMKPAVWEAGPGDVQTGSLWHVPLE